MTFQIHYTINGVLSSAELPLVITPDMLAAKPGFYVDSNNRVALNVAYGSIDPYVSYYLIRDVLYFTRKETP